MSEGRDELIQRFQSGRLKVFPTQRRDHFKFSWPTGRKERKPREVDELEAAISRELLRWPLWSKRAP